MFIISFSLHFNLNMTSRAHKELSPIFLPPPLAPRWRFMGKTAIFHNKAIGINRMYHTFGYIFVNSLFLII